MNADQTVAFARRFGARTEKELLFLARLSAEKHWDVIEQFVPEGELTVKSILRSFEEIGHVNHSNQRIPQWDRNNVISRDMILPQVKLLSLLPETQQELFLLFPALIQFFGYSDGVWRDEAGKTVIGMAYAAMIKMLLNVDECDRWELEITSAVKESPSFPVAPYTQEDQALLISAIQPILHYKDEASAFNLARLLIRTNVLCDQAIDVYWEGLRDEHSWGNQILLRRVHPREDVVLQTLCLARSDQLNPVDVLEGFIHDGHHPASK